MALALKCPSCDAENPEGAEHCNLCFYSFVDRPKPAEPVEPEFAGGGVLKKTVLTPDITSIALKGGYAGAIGGLVFLASLAVIHLTGVRVLNFLFLDQTIIQNNLIFFILVLGLFSLFSAGVGGNLSDQREIVPAVRTVAGLVGLGLWVGVVFIFKPADTGFFLWLTGGLIGIIVSLAVFPLVATFLGMSEAFGEDVSLSSVLWGALAGCLSGIAIALFMGLELLTTRFFGTSAPTGFFGITIFATKLIVITGLTGFAAGAFLWLAIELVKKDTS